MKNDNDHCCSQQVFLALLKDLNFDPTQSRPSGIFFREKYGDKIFKSFSHPVNYREN